MVEFGNLEQLSNNMDSEYDSAKKIEQDSLALSPCNVRKGWAESFQLMAANGDDELLIEI
jgi:hypothetical protein